MKNNIHLVIAYGNSKNQIKTSGKMYSKVFSKERDKVIFFECHLENPVGYSGNISASYIIRSGKTVVTTYERSIKVSPQVNMITVGLIVVNTAGEYIVNGDYTAEIIIGESDAYYFDFTITGKDPVIRYGLFKLLAKGAGL